jgi:hypothetical protein
VHRCPSEFPHQPRAKRYIFQAHKAMAMMERPKAIMKRPCRKRKQRAIETQAASKLLSGPKQRLKPLREPSYPKLSNAQEPILAIPNPSAKKKDLIETSPDDGWEFTMRIQSDSPATAKSFQNAAFVVRTISSARSSVRRLARAAA